MIKNPRLHVVAISLRGVICFIDFPLEGESFYTQQQWC